MRRAIEQVLDLALLGGLFARCCFRLGLQGHLTVTHQEVRLAAVLPRALKIAFASDFHAGPTTDPKLFSSLGEALRLHAPDLLLLGGDFVSARARYIDALAPMLAACAAPLGKYAVLGNHDLWADDTHIVRALTAAGVEVLVNRNAHLPAPFEAVSICGIDDPWSGLPDVARAFDSAGAVRIFMTHSPDGLLSLRGRKFDVGFAGHTHGGQIARRDGSAFILPDGPLCKAYAYGRFDIEANGTFFVSRGIGCSTLPLRINAQPELLLCTVSNQEQEV